MASNTVASGVLKVGSLSQSLSHILYIHTYTYTLLIEDHVFKEQIGHWKFVVLIQQVKSARETGQIYPWGSGRYDVRTYVYTSHVLL